MLFIEAVLAALAGASYLVYGSLHSGRINPLVLLVLAAAVSIASGSARLQTPAGTTVPSWNTRGTSRLP